jgi:hypothetical protein
VRIEAQTKRRRATRSRKLVFVKQLTWACGVIFVVGCGGRANAPDTDAAAGAGASGFAGSPTEVGGASSSAGAPGVGPIDTTGLPEAFPEPLCDGPLKSIHLVLPCKVGMPLSAFNVVECYDTAGRTALSFEIELAKAASSIGQPLPFSSAFPHVPTTSLEVGGVNYTGTLQGTVTFTQVDPAGRAFVASLTRPSVAWKDATGTETDCDLDPMELWATPGNFL